MGEAPYWNNIKIVGELLGIPPSAVDMEMMKATADSAWSEKVRDTYMEVSYQEIQKRLAARPQCKECGMRGTTHKLDCSQRYRQEK